jgi:hypothetical protein
MNTVLRVLPFLVVAAASFALGAWVSAHQGWGSQTVTSTVLNSSGDVLRSVAIEFETCGGTGSAVSGQLEPGASQRLRYSVCGEGAYKVLAVFVDGREVQGGGGYVETGYTTTERVMRDGIASSQSIRAL